MTVMGVSGTASLMTQSLVDLRAQLDDLQRQLSTGQKSETFAGLGVQRGLTVGLQSQLASMSGFDNTITNVGTRLSVAQTALQQIDQSAHTIKQTAVNSSFVIDQSVTRDVMSKVNDSLGAIQAALTPYDEITVFSYSNGAQNRSGGFTGAQSARVPFLLSMVKTSGSCPYIPNSVIEPARSRCAAPHHATAWISEFCTQANSSSKPRMAST